MHYIYEPVGGNCFCVKELSLVFRGIIVMCTIFRTGYIYTYYIFCGDPFFHLRAHPTPDDDVGREDGVGSSRP